MDKTTINKYTEQMREQYQHLVSSKPVLALPYQKKRSQKAQEKPSKRQKPQMKLLRILKFCPTQCPRSHRM